jgi:hypothetical protein
MKLFTRKQDNPLAVLDDGSFWPQDRLDEVDDDDFARAIAEGRLAEQRANEELVTA